MSEQDPAASATDGQQAEFAEHAGQAEFAGHAQQAEFAEFAEHAEFAEFAEHAERAEHAQAEALAGDDAVDEHGHPRHLHGLHLPGHDHADGQQDLLWHREMLRLMDQAARLQAAGNARLHSQDKPEPRWPVSASVIAAIVLQALLPSSLRLHPYFLHYVLLALEGALLIGLAVANPVRIERMSRPVRAASIALIVLISVANAGSAVLLVKAIAQDQLPGGPHAPVELLGTGAAIWATNVIALALWYWEFDRGGPVNRLEGKSPYPDLMFPQMSVPGLTPPGWGPRFVDYLYLSFTNATAFSPTDVMPLARWAKLTMLVQSSISLALGALVIARAVNILP